MPCTAGSTVVSVRYIKIVCLQNQKSGSIVHLANDWTFCEESDSEPSYCQVLVGIRTVERKGSKISSSR